MPNIETLKKIDFVNLNQFLIDLNANFAIVQNSPLYKGIPGNTVTGNTGNQGIRGNQFLFVDFDKFKLLFPELIKNSDIDINFINTKISLFSSRNLILNNFGITEFVNNDIIVLTNSLMLSYNDGIHLFIDTKLAFNQELNLIQSIETKIENFVQYYVSQNPTILNLTNIFQKFSTYAKNCADTDNLPISNIQTISSIYAPYIENLTNTNGVLLNNHKYFGFTDNDFPETNDSTFVFGSIKKYTKMLMNTIDLNSAQPLSSDYAPGVDNIPAVVVLQDTPNNGLLFGLKTDLNLRKFGSIYKDSNDNVIIRTNSGILPSEYSELILNRLKLTFAKYVDFGDDLKVAKDFILGGNIDNKFLRSAQFAGINPKLIQVGYKNVNDTDGEWENISKEIYLTKFPNNIILTDSNGKISKEYALDSSTYNNANLPNLTNIANVPTSNKKIPTSNQIGFIIQKLNNIANYVSTNYYTKNDFVNGIPSLLLTEDFRIYDNILHDVFKVEANSGRVFLGSSIDGYVQFNTDKIKFSQNYEFAVLVCDSQGELTYSYSIEDMSIPVLEEVAMTQFTTLTNYSDNKILLSSHLKSLLRKFNNLTTHINSTYWKKNEFATGVIPELKIGELFSVYGFIVDGTTGQVEIGGDNDEPIIFKNDNIIFPNGTGKKNVLVTSPTGGLLSSYVLSEDANDNNFVRVFTSTTQTENVANGIIPTQTNQQWGNTATKTDNEYDLITGKQWGWLIRLLNNIKIRFLNTFNKVETLTQIHSFIPDYSIVLFEESQGIPDEWYKCDGTVVNIIKINGPNSGMSTYTTPIFPNNGDGPVQDSVYIMKVPQSLIWNGTKYIRNIA